MNPTINQEINVLRDFIDQNDDLGIVIGVHQNLDTVASALAFYLSLSQTGKKVQIISKKQPTVEISNLVGIDRIKESFIGTGGKLIISLPYVKGEVEKVLFTEAPNTINFHLTAAPGRSITPFEVNDIKLNWEGGAPTAIITIGVSTIDELNGIIDVDSSKIVNIDNYPGNTRFGDIVIVNEAFSSLSEIVGKVLKDLQLPMDIDISQNILDGVLFATKNFTKQNTSPFAFEAVSTAMYNGAQRKMEENQERREGSNINQSRQQSQDKNRGGERRHQQVRQRVNDNDFPAIHMQGGRNQQNPQQDNKRVNPSRAYQSQNQSHMTHSQFSSQQQQTSHTDIREKLARATNPQPQFETEDAIEDAQLVNEQRQYMPGEDTRIPQEESFDTQNPEEIPDDWLMPKVFKSSSNNN